MVQTAKALCSRVGRSWSTRTWKREVASMLLMVWSWSYLKCTVFPPTVEYMNAANGPLGIGTAAIFGFAIAAFGLDVIIKQMPGVLPGTSLPQQPVQLAGPGAPAGAPPR